MANLVRVVFYVVDDFANPHFLRKNSIGYVTREQYEACTKYGNYTCFDVGDDFYAEHFHDTITI